MTLYVKPYLRLCFMVLAFVMAEIHPPHSLFPVVSLLHYLKGNTTHVRKETKVLSKKQNKKKENQKFLAKENQKTKMFRILPEKKLRKTEKIGKKQIKKIKQKNKKLTEKKTFFTCRSNPLVTSCSPDAQNCREMQVFHLPNQPSRHFGCPKPLRNANFHVAKQSSRYFVLVGRPTLWRNANFSRCEATFSSLRARRMPETVVEW